MVHQSLFYVDLYSDRTSVSLSPMRNHPQLTRKGHDLIEEISGMVTVVVVLCATERSKNNTQSTHSYE